MTWHRLERPLYLTAFAIAVVIAIASGGTLAGCCKTPKPRPPTVVTAPADCLAEVDPPLEEPFHATTCPGPLVLCFDYAGAAKLAAKIAELYRYRDQVESRCRPRSQAREPEEASP